MPQCGETSAEPGWCVSYFDMTSTDIIMLKASCLDKILDEFMHVLKRPEKSSSFDVQLLQHHLDKPH